MSEWKEVVEEGQTFFINEEVGNIVKADEQTFICLLPKMVRLGPFNSLEEAKSAIENNKESLNKHLENFNNQLTNFSEVVRVD